MAFLKLLFRAFMPTLFMSWGGGDDEEQGSGAGQTGYTGATVVTHPQYSFTEPRRRLASDFVSQNIQRMSEGRYPAYYEQALPQLREAQQRPLREQYFGSPMGGSGILEAQRSAGAATGLGPRQTTAQTNKALLEYSNKERQIDEYLTKMGVGIMQADAYRFPQLSQQMQGGPDVSVFGPQPFGVPERPNYTGQALGGMAENMPWGNIVQGVGGMFGGGGEGGAGGAMTDTGGVFPAGWLGGEQGYGGYGGGGGFGGGSTYSSQVNAPSDFGGWGTGYYDF